jgi:hypothetical protein
MAGWFRGPPLDQVFDTLIGDMDGVCELPLGYVHRDKKLFIYIIATNAQQPTIQERVV